MLGRPFQDAGNIHGCGARRWCQRHDGWTAVVVPRLCNTQAALFPKGTSVKGRELSASSLTLESVRAITEDRRGNAARHPHLRGLCESILECRKRSTSSRKVKLIRNLIGELRQLGTNTDIS
ncbi:unnamed protein product [Ixodes hexagonus]